MTSMIHVFAHNQSINAVPDFHLVSKEAKLASGAAPFGLAHHILD